MEVDGVETAQAPPQITSEHTTEMDTDPPHDGSAPENQHKQHQIDPFRTRESDTNVTIAREKLANLEEAKAILHRPDSILELDVLLNLKKYIQNGGNPQEVIKALSSSYRGYPQMCNLICHWLRLAGASDNEIVQIVKSHLRDAISENFDPEKADLIFQLDQSEPLWLAEMIKELHWRQLIYDLSKSHRSCSLLTYGIQLISVAGHDDEIAAVPSAAALFPVFLRVCMNTIQHALSSPEEQLAESISGFASLAGLNEHTFIVPQSLLLYASSSDPTGKLKRIAEEIYNVAAEGSKQEFSIDSIKLQQAFFNFSRLHMTNIHHYTTLASALSSILTSEHPSPGDLRKIQMAYTQAGNFPVPSPEHLRFPQLLDKIIVALFEGQQEIPSEYLPNYIWVLAYASCSPDTRPISPKDKPDAAATLQYPSDFQQICDMLTDTRSSLMKLNFQGIPVIVVDKLRGYIKACPMASQFVLHWIENQLCDPEKAVSTWTSTSLPLCWNLIRAMILYQEHQRGLVLQMLSNALLLDPALGDLITASNFKKCLADCVVYLAECSYFMPVLKKMEQLTKHLDQSIIRHFLVKLLYMLAPGADTLIYSPVLRMLASVHLDPSEHKSIIAPHLESINRSPTYSPAMKDSAKSILNSLSK